MIGPGWLTGCAMLAEPGAETPRFKTPSELYHRAVALYEKGNYAQARALLHEFVGSYPDSALYRIALYYLGHCYQVTGDDKEALVIFNRVVTTYGDDDFWGAQAFKRIKQIKGEEWAQ
jgi:TolA-binding protein